MNYPRVKKALRILLPAAVVVGAATAWYATRTPASPFDRRGESSAASSSAASAELIQRGEYVARLGDCVACHSTPGSRPFVGGLAMETPLGAIYTTNITPDPATGIGRYTLADFDRAMRHGVAKDGRRLYPAMPYPSYAKMSDEDIEALYAYFMKDVTPVQRQNRDSEISWPMNMRWPLALWNGVFADAGVYRPVAAQDASWNRGAYLVQGAGHCGSCHTPRGLTMNEKGLDQSSDDYLAGAEIDGWYAPSLRGDAKGGIGRWSEDEIAGFLKTGRNQHAVVFGSMAEVFNNSTQFMRDDDLKAIARYLKSLPGKSEAPAVAAKSQAPSASAALDERLRTPGAQTFETKCSACHGRDGAGQGQWIPPLAGSSASMASIHASSINATLNGSARVVAAGVPDAYRMPPFRNQLTDREIAEVLTYVRTSWGNKGGAVSAADVAKARARTKPASSEPVVLPLK